MVFNSLTFVVFFAIVLGLHNLPISWTWKKLNLLLASYLFYAAWNPPFVLLLLLVAAIDFVLAKRIAATPKVAQKRLCLAISLVLNLGILGAFKYGSFLLDNFVRMLALVGVHFQAAAPNLILPLGISFYTFETISYLVDIYRGRSKPCDSFLDYGLFLTFFPHLVAGPIVRAYDFLPQCLEPRRASARQLGWGFSLLVLGLFEKTILADAILAPVADKVFGAAQAAAFVDAWVGTLAFAGQIFFDFADYSTCAIGAALCLGFVLNDNFRFPYAAVGFSDFWQRWHISLSSWLRDYLYIPLGGNRKGTIRTGINLLATMLLGGLWHGASWLFVAWGGLHGLFLIVERRLTRVLGKWLWIRTRPAQLAGPVLTFTAVCATWVFFRAATLPQAFRMLRQMARVSGDLRLVSGIEAVAVVMFLVAVLTGQWLLRNMTLERVVGSMPWWLRSACPAGLLVCLALAPGDDRAFIYFQF